MLKGGRELMRVGYWQEPGFVSALLSGLPRVEDCVDTNWDPAERARVIGYLKRGKVKDQWMGYSDCRLCGALNGSACLTDGVYVWPEGFAHYLEAHGVKPPQHFVAHALRRGA
jgi:hypothetical protein